MFPHSVLILLLISCVAVRDYGVFALAGSVYRSTPVAVHHPDQDETPGENPSDEPQRQEDYTCEICSPSGDQTDESTCLGESQPEPELVSLLVIADRPVVSPSATESLYTLMRLRI
jgi:hypothetical protein